MQTQLELSSIAAAEVQVCSSSDRRESHFSDPPPPSPNTHNTDIAIKECAAYAGIAVHSGTEEDDYQTPNSKFPKYCD